MRVHRSWILASASSLMIAAAGLSCGSEAALEAPTTGDLDVAVATSGTEPDADGYVLRVDGDSVARVGPSGTARATGLSAGNHTVMLDGTAGNCAAADNPRTVSVVAGESASVAFAVACSASTGHLVVTTATSGSALDADGYVVLLDGTSAGAIGSTGTLALDALAPGARQVGLSGIAGNCTLQGDNPRAVTITAGDTTAVALSVTCVEPSGATGALRVTVTSTGSALDPDGYRFALDGGATQPVGANGSITLGSVAVGTHTVRLTGVAGNCALQGAASRSVEIAANATADVAFTISCAPVSGSIRISATTTGDSLDADGYTVAVDRSSGRSLGVNDTALVDAVTPGAHTVTLSGVASTCRVDGDSSRTVTVGAGNTASVEYAVACARSPVAPPPGPPIVFGSIRNGIYDLFTVNPDGTDLLNLTHGSPHGAALVPRWSPDHSRVAFFDAGVRDLYRVEADGTGLLKLTDTGGVDELTPIWSPDGTKLAFATIAQDPDDFVYRYRLFVVQADGTGLHQLSARTDVYGDPSWSPDGSKLVFATTDQERAQIHLIGVDGTPFTTLTGDGSAWSPQFSPDGRRIAFIMQPSGGEPKIWVMNADGTDQRPLTILDRAGSFEASPQWSPDGTRLLFTSAFHDDTSHQSDIWTMNADGGDRRQLTHTADDAINAEWSPDGREIVYEIDKGDPFPTTDRELRVVSADGSNDRLIDPLGGFWPDW